MVCAKGDDANGATAKGQSSTFRRKVQPRSGMHAQPIPKRGRGIPALPDPRFRRAPRATLWGATGLHSLAS
jgi:hypothetical protein